MGKTLKSWLPQGCTLMVWQFKHGIMLCLDRRGRGRGSPPPPPRWDYEFHGGGGEDPPTPYIEGNILEAGFYSCETRA